MEKKKKCTNALQDKAYNSSIIFIKFRCSYLHSVQSEWAKDYGWWLDKGASV